MSKIFTVALLALALVGCKGKSACPSGQVTSSDMGTCVPLSQSCEDSGDGGVASKCSAIHRLCQGAGDSIGCGACMTGYTAPEGICRPLKTCADLSCAANGMNCTDATGTTDASCGDCMTGLIKVGTSCVAPSCDSTSAGSIVASCQAAQRVCTPDSPAHCGACVAGLKEDANKSCIPVVTCAQLSCGSQNRVCESETSSTDATCGACLGGFVDNAGVCQVIANATCAAAPAAGSILASCTAMNRDCTAGSPATCGACSTGFVEDTTTGKCLLAQACATAGCDALHRQCSETPTGHCTTCSAGYVQDSQSGLCRAALTCADLICGSTDGGAQQQCQPSVVDPVTGVTTDAVCHSSCNTGTLWNGTACQPCPPCNGSNENGPETVPTSGGYCICKTKPGYFYSLGGNIGTYACDADNDGWVRESARSAVNSTDPVMKQNAQCTVRSVARFQLFGEGATSPTTIALPASVPLFETDRNDDDQILKGYWQVHNLVSYTGATRDMTAAELNRLTKICHDPKNDYNDNGVADVAEYPDEALSPSLLAEQKVFNQYSYFIELDWGAYLQPVASATIVTQGNSSVVTGTGFSRSWVGQTLSDGTTTIGTVAWVSDAQSLLLVAPATHSYMGPPTIVGFSDGTYTIHERSRVVTSGRELATVPIDYGPNNGAYWRTCSVRQDTEWAVPEDGSDHTVGMELQGLTDPSGNVIATGMNHHSQFKCTVVGDADPAHPEVRPWSAIKGDKYVLDTCSGLLDVVNPGNASGTTIQCAPTYDPAVSAGSEPPVGTVGWGAVPYTHYDLFFDRASFTALEQPPPAPEYVRGCVNDCEVQYYPLCESSANITSSAGDPAAAQCIVDDANFGKFSKCVTQEVCDGIDNNNNGQKDETFPGKGSACNSTQYPKCTSSVCQCYAGQEVCANAGTPTAQVVCQSIKTPAANDPCDGIDNDCNGIVDDSDPTIGTACTVTDTTACNGHACLGNCLNGTWICDASHGSRYCKPSAPRNEDCVSNADLDCNGVLYNAPLDNTCPAAFGQFYPDQDRDGYAAANSTAKCLCNDTSKRPSTLSYYTVSANSPNINQSDTCDVCTDGSPLSSAALVHPSSTAHAFMTTADCCKSFDWDSNGQQEQATTAIGQDSCHWSNFSCGSNSTTGWVLTSIPACGQSAQYMNGGCHYVSGSGCYPDEVSAVQSCR